MILSSRDSCFKHAMYALLSWFVAIFSGLEMIACLFGGFSKTQMSTSSCFFLLGIACIFFQNKKTKYISRIFGVVVFIASLSFHALWIFNYDLNLMGPTSSLAFLVSSFYFAFNGFDRQKNILINHQGIFLILVGFLSFSGNLFQGVNKFNSPLHSSICFILIGWANIFLSWIEEEKSFKAKSNEYQELIKCRKSFEKRNDPGRLVRA